MAAPYDQAQALFDDGRYAEAARLATIAGDSKGLALAARCWLAAAAYTLDGAEKSQALVAGEQAARAALAKNPDNIEALLHLVIALGYKSRDRGYIKAHFAGYGKEAGKLIDRALRLDRDNAWARAVKAGWHAEIVAAAGGLLAKILYGASRREADLNFEAAIGADPDNPVFRIEYAKALLRIGGRRATAKARHELETGLSLPATGAFEKRALAEAGELLAAANKGNRRQIVNTVRRLSPFARIPRSPRKLSR